MTQATSIKSDRDTELSVRQKQILSILQQHGKMFFRDIKGLLVDPPADRTLRDDLAKLKKLALIDSEGAGRGARWFLYRE